MTSNVICQALRNRKLKKLIQAHNQLEIELGRKHSYIVLFTCPLMMLHCLVSYINKEKIYHRKM